MLAMTPLGFCVPGLASLGTMHSLAMPLLALLLLVGDSVPVSFWAGRFLVSGGWNSLKTSAAVLYRSAYMVRMMFLRPDRRLVPCSFANLKMSGEIGRAPSSIAFLYLEFLATATNPAMFDVLS